MTARLLDLSPAVSRFFLLARLLILMSFGLEIGPSQAGQEIPQSKPHSGTLGHRPTLTAQWKYLGVEGPEHWSMLTPEYRTCEEGRQQSPINITMTHHGHAPETLEFHYQTSELHELNNGHTIQVSHTSGCHVNLNHRRYQLRQFHFHAPSEHHIEGKTFPMEMHLVHQDTQGHVLVIAIMLKIGAEEPVLQNLWTWLPKQIGQEVSIPLSLSIADILPKHTRHFSYSGSLTTPPCTEGIQWIVLEGPILISQKDVDQFVDIIGHNARPIQPLGNRHIDKR
ncbi:carbonic anhydrase [Candidatus Nitronereus thalassa]|uniref:Carbonic anhydrase n=1 Tax=Candidatus Nitronereus thalassa TaxID=3020898 RepID=A0ABU3KCK1_9BACT|nr:carbonic anhydrase family protein [Candidatus Nitronereus thalassa]MDT7044033.1 carbonic anhydrase family protein [Candidatus Nitronereus thalassa]